MAGRLMRWRVLTRLPLTWGWMAKRPIPREMLDAWFTPLREEHGTRRDAARFMRAVDHRDLLSAAAKLPSFNRPALIIWAAEDRVMPPGHAQRLAGLLPDARIAMVPDSYMLIPLDQPQRLATLVREFVKNA